MKPQRSIYKRKSEGRTDYKKRLILLKSEKPRLVIRRSLNNILVQIIEYMPDGDKVITSANSSSLSKLGWKGHRGNLSSAYLTGLICGLKAKSKNIKEAVLDLGLRVSIKGSAQYAGLKGVLDAQIKIPHSNEVLPSMERIESKEGFKETKERILKEKW